MQGKVFPAFPFVGLGFFQNSQYVPPYDIAHAAENNQEGSDGVDKGVERISAQAVFCDDINPCVAKRGNGIEDGNPNPARAKILRKNGKVQKCAGKFNHQRAEENFFDEVGKPRK